MSAAESYTGRPYDFHYALDDDYIYCSELVYKGFKKVIGRGLGQTKQLGDLNWRPHEAFIRSMEDGALPLAREMITPVDLSRAPELQPVPGTGG